MSGVIYGEKVGRETLRRWHIMNYNAVYFVANSYQVQRPALKGSFSSVYQASA